MKRCIAAILTIALLWNAGALSEPVEPETSEELELIEAVEEANGEEESEPVREADTGLCVTVVQAEDGSGVLTAEASEAGAELYWQRLSEGAEETDEAAWQDAGTGAVCAAGSGCLRVIAVYGDEIAVSEIVRIEDAAEMAEEGSIPVLYEAAEETIPELTGTVDAEEPIPALPGETVPGAEEEELLLTEEAPEEALAAREISDPIPEPEAEKKDLGTVELKADSTVDSLKAEIWEMIKTVEGEDELEADSLSIDGLKAAVGTYTGSYRLEPEGLTQDFIVKMSWTESFTVGSFTLTVLDAERKVLSVSGYAGTDAAVTVGIDPKALGTFVYDGWTITMIEGGAFSKLETLESLTIGDGIHAIAPNATSDCKNLSSVTLPATIGSIGSGEGNAIIDACPKVKGVKVVGEAGEDLRITEHTVNGVELGEDVRIQSIELKGGDLTILDDYAMQDGDSISVNGNLYIEAGKTFTHDKGTLLYTGEYKRSATATYTGKTTKAYDGRAFAVAKSDFGLSDGCTVASVKTDIEAVKPGSYTLVVTVTATDPDVVVAPVKIPVTITKAKLKVTFVYKAKGTDYYYKVYDGTSTLTGLNSAANFPFTGKVGNEDVALKSIKFATFDRTAVGTYTLKISFTLKGNDADNYEADPISITVKILEKETVTIQSIITKMGYSTSAPAIRDQKYTGRAITPDVSLKDGTYTLVKDRDYTITFTNNINVGVASYTITGKGNYTGTYSGTFKINREPGSGGSYYYDIVLSCSKLYLGKYQMSDALYDLCMNPNLTWVSSKPSVVYVDMLNGELTCLASSGYSDITASDPYGNTATCRVYAVAYGVEYFELPQQEYVPLGGTVTLKAEFDGNPSNKTLTWRSTDTSIATVSSRGVVTGKRYGTVEIIATASSGLETSCFVEVIPQPVTSIRLSRSNLSIVHHSRAALTATVGPKNAANQRLVWFSSSEDIATVDDYGNVSAIMPGTAVITCEAADGSGKYADCTVTVKPNPVKTVSVKYGGAAVRSLKLVLEDELGRVNDGFAAAVLPADATDGRVTWTSSKPTVVRITDAETGAFEVVGSGTAVITCSALDGSRKRATCTVTVQKTKATTVKVFRDGTEIARNATITVARGSVYDGLEATVLPEKVLNREVTWRSSNARVLEISAETGVMTAKTAGIATITCTSKDNSMARVTFKVRVE